jgi:hypothetical protein
MYIFSQRSLGAAHSPTLLYATGFNSEVFLASFFRMYFDYQRDTNNLTFPLTPMMASRLFGKYTLMVRKLKN